MEAKSQFTQLYFPRFVPSQHRSSVQAPSDHCRPSQRIWILMPFRFPLRGSSLSYNRETLPASLWLNMKIKSPECISERRDPENAHKSRPAAQPVPPSLSVCRECFLQGRAYCITKACHLGAKIKSGLRVFRYILDEIPSLTKECCRFLPLTSSI